MRARRALVIMAVGAVVGTAVWALRGPGPKPPAPAPAPLVTEEEPEPIEEAPAPLEPPPRAESPAELVARLIRVLAETADRPPAAREAAVVAVIDISSVVPAAFGTAWTMLSFAQRVAAAHDLRAILAAQAIRGAREWLRTGRTLPRWRTKGRRHACVPSRGTTPRSSSFWPVDLGAPRKPTRFPWVYGFDRGKWGVTVLVEPRRATSLARP